MKINDDALAWKELYAHWGIAIMKFPELQGNLDIRRVAIHEPKYGPVYFYNWVDKRNEEAAIREDVRKEASTWQEIGSEWSKGTLTTATLLASSKTPEELAAVWITAFALALQKRLKHHNALHHNAFMVVHSASAVFAQRYGYWHHNSSNFFPEFYVPYSLLWDDVPLTQFVIVELAALNAAHVLAHFTPIEYIRE